MAYKIDSFRQAAPSSDSLSSVQLQIVGLVNDNIVAR